MKHSGNYWKNLPQTIRKAIVAAEARRRLEVNPLKWIEHPATGEIIPLRLLPVQLEAMRACEGRIVFGVIGGNRLGKSLWAAVYAASAGLGVPWQEWPGLPLDPSTWQLGPKRTIWCVTVTFEKSRDGQQKFLWDRIPRSCWRSVWNEENGFYRNKAVLRNGTEFVFKTQKQGLSTFETSAVDLIWIDETVRESVFTACLPRIVDRRGKIIWTTIFDDPLLEDLFIRRQLHAGMRKHLSEADVGMIGGTMRDNPLLSEKQIALIESMLSPVEREIRIMGRPAYYRGLVYGDYDESLHLEQVEFPPPAEWRRVEVIDPGWSNPCGVLFVGVDRHNVYHGYDELYERRRTVGEMAAMIFLKRWEHSGQMRPREILEYKRLCGIDAEREEFEPVGSMAEQLRRDRRLGEVIKAWRASKGNCQPDRCLMGEESEQRDQGKPVNIHRQFSEFGIHAEKCSNKDKGGQRMKMREQLRPMHGRVGLKVNVDCAYQIFEFTHYRMAPPDEETGEYLDDKEKVVKAHDHLMNCWEWLCAAAPLWRPPEGRDAPTGSPMGFHREALEQKRDKSKRSRRLG